MILTIDIGNTKVKLGVYNGNDFIHSSNLNDINEFLDEIKKLKKYSFTNSIISSVVPHLTKKYNTIIEKKLSTKSLIINSNNANINLKVDEPNTVGHDRLCNIKAAIELYKIPAIIIDFGTATTYDVIDEHSNFIGGIIAPGVETSSEYLIKKAALLKKTDLKFPPKIIGVNTKENIQSGIMYGAVQQIEGFINKINLETGRNNNIILTGGFSKMLSPKLSFKHQLDINLTLKGMILINESNY